MTATEVDSQQFNVNDREQLIYLLTEAAEIEHGLLCSYLYAMWSLKRSPDEGLSTAQAEAIPSGGKAFTAWRWKRCCIWRWSAIC